MSKPSTKDRIIETALNLVWQSNYSSVSVDDICKAADVRKGSFYYHFPSKLDLTVAAVECYYQQKKANLDQIFSLSDSPLKRINNFFDYASEKAKKDRELYGRVMGCPVQALASEMVGKDGDEARLQAYCKDAENLFMQYWKATIQDLEDEGIIPESGDVDAKVRNLHAFLMGLVALAKINNDLDHLEEDLQTGIAKILEIPLAEIKKAGT